MALLARDIDPRDAAARLALVGDALRVTAGAPPPAWISEPVADAKGLAPGALLTLPLAGRAVTFTVAGIWRDYVRQQGAVVIERSRYVALTGDDAVNEATLWLAPGVDAAAVRDDVARAAGAGRVLTATPADLRKLSLAAFDRTFAVTYALEAAAVLIGVVGLSAALVAQTLARQPGIRNAAPCRHDAQAIARDARRRRCDTRRHRGRGGASCWDSRSA